MIDPTRWFDAVDRSVDQAITEMKAAKLTREEGGVLLAAILANIAYQIDTGITGFRQSLIIKLTTDEGERKGSVIL